MDRQRVVFVITMVLTIVFLVNGCLPVSSDPEIEEMVTIENDDEVDSETEPVEETAPSIDTAPEEMPKPQPHYVMYGLNFSPYTMEGQDPNFNTLVTEEQTEALLVTISPYTEWIRTFGCSGSLEDVAAQARELGLKTAVGAWLDKDLEANEKEIAKLIKIAEQGDTNLLIVGSEVLLRKDLSADDLIAYISQVKTAVPWIKLAYADTYDVIMKHSKVVDAVDVILVNYYPYWEGIAVEEALRHVNGNHEKLLSNVKGKTVIVGETGWPSSGDTIGEAVPSAENAAYYFLNFVSWARANGVSYFYFEAFDEPWKSEYEGPQGAYWGLWENNGELKRGMQAVFDGITIPDNWSSVASAETSKAPAIEFTSVPSYGTSGTLKGLIRHVNSSDYSVAVYIKVGGGWWTKPYWNQPLTAIKSDGSWSCAIVTGGNDQNATQIIAYLIPKGYEPPLLNGDSSLPAALNSNSVARVSVNRNP
jgi:exo-beta-1,3-glucanase (GH17 family)